MKAIAVAAAVLVTSACIATHLTMEIPPPGGCDQCHRQKIAANWEVSVAPVALGKEGGVPAESDVLLRGLQSVPYHSEVPVRKLAIYAAAAPAGSLGDEETGIQCFQCHRSPGPPHEKARGNHPWGQRPSPP
ncbi:MAG: hypothetical protein HZB55_16160 [Deltaproteobacteria bacterium]|nr:hypothetical protein [Deltaproteobacteria bacterium]